MTWRDASVTVDAEQQYIIKSVLGDITIDDKGIWREELKSEEDWHRITGTMDAEEIFQGHLPWAYLKEVDAKTHHLSYPHIDLLVEDEDGNEHRLMLFFKDESPDGYDDVDHCLSTIKKAWAANRQRRKIHTLDYDFQDDAPQPAAAQVDVEDDEPEPEPDEQPQDGPEPEQKNEQAESSPTDILETAAEDPQSIMDMFGD
ncbi:MAG: hypothetical protein MUP66_02215 [Candidatus Nanohaloarchaeota archaeon QJJ-5]|nr:hypothetical protein [Candidatus Nanohaloarchaeota archaeon QJJ-5]